MLLTHKRLKLQLSINLYTWFLRTDNSSLTASTKIHELIYIFTCIASLKFTNQREIKGKQNFKLQKKWILPIGCYIAAIDRMTGCTWTRTFFSTVASIFCGEHGKEQFRQWYPAGHFMKDVSYVINNVMKILNKNIDIKIFKVFVISVQQYKYFHWKSW